jgi:hypothetical protein
MNTQEQTHTTHCQELRSYKRLCFTINEHKTQIALCRQSIKSLSAHRSVVSQKEKNIIKVNHGLVLPDYHNETDRGWTAVMDNKTAVMNLKNFVKYHKKQIVQEEKKIHGVSLELQR